MFAKRGIVRLVASGGSRKSVHLTMVTPNGLADTPQRHMIQSEVTLDDLFA